MSDAPTPRRLSDLRLRDLVTLDTRAGESRIFAPLAREILAHRSAGDAVQQAAIELVADGHGDFKSRMLRLRDAVQAYEDVLAELGDIEPDERVVAGTKPPRPLEWMDSPLPAAATSLDLPSLVSAAEDQADAVLGTTTTLPAPDADDPEAGA